MTADATTGQPEPCEDTQFTRALRRAAAGGDPDPEAAVAPFNSAF